MRRLFYGAAAVAWLAVVAGNAAALIPAVVLTALPRMFGREPA